jgi:hypothetical protein
MPSWVMMPARPFYAPQRGRSSLPPGRYFRMLLVGYFEGIDSERGLEWRYADSLSLREFLWLGEREPVPPYGPGWVQFPQQSCEPGSVSSVLNDRPRRACHGDVRT